MFLLIMAVQVGFGSVGFSSLFTLKYLYEKVKSFQHEVGEGFERTSSICSERILAIVGLLVWATSYKHGFDFLT